MGMQIGKHKFLKIFTALSALIIFGLAARIYYAGSLVPECNEGIAESLVSPDGRWVAEKVIGVCDGATGVVSLEVRLHGPRKDAATVLDMDLVDGDKVALKWKDPINLIVSFPIKEAVYKQETSLDDVTIQYITDR